MNKFICVIGLGYVGLPLAVEFAKKYQVIGFDINKSRVKSLLKGHDENLEVDDKDLEKVLIRTKEKGLKITDSACEIKNCNIFIVTVPTPVDINNKPNLDALMNSSMTIAEFLKKNDIVIYESTVYPGVTEDVCVPILEKVSGLNFNTDFYCGYSPERINPGDKKRKLNQILKVTSGSTPEIGEKVNDLYSSIITAGTHLAPSIKVAEASKVIENAQRDINIAFINELAKIFNKLELDTHAILEAASTKWNFLPFKPGLVGGHCISVDPFYLAQKAQEAGYYSEIILAGRRLNDSMGSFVANEVIKLMILKKVSMVSPNVLILGLTFKENCPDITNSKAIDVFRSLSEYNFNIDVYDPWANKELTKQKYGIDLLANIDKKYDVIILAVAHDLFIKLDFLSLKKDSGVIYDVKGFLPRHLVDKRL